MGIHRLLYSSCCFLNTNTAITCQLIRTARTLEAEWCQFCGEAWVRGQREMSQVLGAFGLLDFTMLRPVLAWRTFFNLWTVYFFNFPIFFRAAPTAGTAVHLYSVACPSVTLSIMNQTGPDWYWIRTTAESDGRQTTSAMARPCLSFFGGVCTAPMSARARAGMLVLIMSQHVYWWYDACVQRAADQRSRYRKRSISCMT